MTSSAHKVNYNISLYLTLIYYVVCSVALLVYKIDLMILPEAFLILLFSSCVQLCGSRNIFRIFLKIVVGKPMISFHDIPC